MSLSLAPQTGDVPEVQHPTCDLQLICQSGRVRSTQLFRNVGAGGTSFGEDRSAVFDNQWHVRTHLC
jgi:hypothetical protein